MKMGLDLVAVLELMLGLGPLTMRLLLRKPEQELRPRPGSWLLRELGAKLRWERESRLEPWLEPEAELEQELQHKLSIVSRPIFRVSNWSVAPRKQ